MIIPTMCIAIVVFPSQLSTYVAYCCSYSYNMRSIAHMYLLVAVL